MTKGFSNWKDGTVCFKKPALSKSHLEAVEKVITLPQTTQDVGEQLSKAHMLEKQKARDMLYLILSSVRFLARQGLALRGDHCSEESNLTQLLRLRSECNPEMLQWLAKHSNKHVSPENQNEMLQLMAHQVLRKILGDMHQSPFLTLMVDETTDVSNKEQLTLILRWVDSDFVVSEEFLGLYNLATANAQSIVDIISDTFLRLQISFSKLRGQCYDWCNTMAGAKGGEAAKIAQLEPRAVFTHCYGHALSLGVSDTVKTLPVLRDCLDTCFELVRLVKFSPKREAMLRGLKEEIGSDAPSVRTMCPTRWTVCAQSLSSILVNYDNLQLLWETAFKSTTETDVKARIRGIVSQMDTFKFFFSLSLCELILHHTDKLSQTLQQPKLSSVEGHHIAMMTVKTLEGIRTERDFELFWEKLENRRECLEIDEPCLPRKRKVPKRFEDGDAEAEFPKSPADYYRRIYFEALDLAVVSIRNRFNQQGFKTFSTIEQLIFTAAKGECFTENLDAVCSFFEGDFNKEELKSELTTFQHLYKSAHQEDTEASPTIDSVKSALLTLSSSQRVLISSVSRLFQLLLILPAINSTSERSFSALRRVKSYLRSTMSQARLNHLMVLHYHRPLTDTLDLHAVCNEYISKNTTRKNTFAMF